MGQGVSGWPREVAGWPAHVAKAPPLFPNVVVVDVKERVVEEKRAKEGGDGRLAKLWPPFSSTFHHPPHLDPLMLKPLTKSINSKANSFHLLPKFIYFFLKFLDFITCNDEINKHSMEKSK
jgi:hypothetical protein